MANQSGLEMQAHLEMRMRTVAERIVEAARLAAAAHLMQSLHQTSEHYGQRVAIGGAGPIMPGVSEDSRLPSRPPRGDIVTDDESPAPPPGAPGRGHVRPAPRYNPAD